ncbi:hypothetical protein yc1106_04545 [Curvularia clavata]|uniref:Zinc finger GRF-type domain-containing protein n=1 Tax=Curvularia clavata TaxID=95742 RepID=A0A9Q9DTC7_CURCL|nr:hypothetical protein yc1106_04545 [Curvularia clavata]
MAGSRGTKGLFIQGVWNCAVIALRDCPQSICKPRSQARTMEDGVRYVPFLCVSCTSSILSHLPVRTCNKPPGKQCKFFLWDDDAPARENSAVASMATPPTSSRKRTHSISSGLDKYHSVKVKEEYDPDEVFTQTEMPSKAAKVANFSTPVTNRRTLLWEAEQSSSAPIQEPHTPQTEPRTQGDFINSRASMTGASPYPSSAASQDNAHHIGTPYSTPRTSINRTPNLSQDEGVEEQGLVNDAFDLLQKFSIRLPNQTQEELKALLTKHVKRTEGYKRGREVTRLTVKAKDAKITELTYRVSTLEAELEAEKAMVKHLQWEAQNQTSSFD